MALVMSLYLIDISIGARFEFLDSLTAAFLICSALLRNERYKEYYTYRFFGMIASVIIWIVVMVEYTSFNALAIAILYLAYLVFDCVNYVVQKKTYVNEYMIQVERYNEVEKIAKIKNKLSAYEKIKQEKNRD